MARRDFTNDGASDVVWHTLDGQYAIWDFGRDGGLGVTFLPTINDTRYFNVGSGDYDGDGWLDFAWQYFGRGAGSDYFDGAGFWRFANGVPVTFQAVTASAPGSDFPQPAVLTSYHFSIIPADSSDFNHDGRSDFVLLHDDRPRLSLATLYNGQISLLSNLDFPAVYTPMGLADYNGDGTTDVLWRHTVNGEVGMWSISNAVPYAWTSFGEIPLEWTVRESGDFNGDGRADLLWFKETADGGVGAGIWTSVGGGGYGYDWHDFGVFYGGWEPAEVGDFTGDGSEDILWRNLLSGDNLVWDMDGGVQSRAFFLFSVPLEWSAGG